MVRNIADSPLQFVLHATAGEMPSPALKVALLSLFIYKNLFKNSIVWNEKGRA